MMDVGLRVLVVVEFTGTEVNDNGIKRLLDSEKG